MRIKPAVLVRVLIVLLSMEGASCGGAAEIPGTSASSALSSNFQPLLSPQQIEIVRQTFPRFQPEYFRDGKIPVQQSPNPSDYSPAQFYGQLTRTESRTTPYGITYEAYGLDEPSQISILPDSGTYFDRSGNPYSFTLGMASRAPLNVIEERLGRPLTPNAPVVMFDRRHARVDAAEIDRILLEVQTSLMIALPAVATVDPRRCEVVILPTIFYVGNSNFGSTWAGGVSENMGGGRYRLQLAAFYISSTRVLTDWRDYLVYEAINFYVTAIGRPDLAK